jgi:hypothetical protein
MAKENVNRSETRQQKFSKQTQYSEINPLNAEINPIRHMLALLGAHHILHVSRIRVNMRVKRSIRKDKRNWINKQVKLAEGEKKGNIKELYNITRKLSQRKFRMNRPVKTKLGMLLTTQEEQLERRQKHFSQTFNQDDDEAENKKKWEILKIVIVKMNRSKFGPSYKN